MKSALLLLFAAVSLSPFASSNANACGRGTRCLPGDTQAAIMRKACKDTYAAAQVQKLNFQAAGDNEADLRKAAAAALNSCQVYIAGNESLKNLSKALSYGAKACKDGEDQVSQAWLPMCQIQLLEFAAAIGIQ